MLNNNIGILSHLKTMGILSFYTIKNMKDIHLTRTQLFLRFLKKRHLYNDYLREIHSVGRYRLCSASNIASSKNSTDILEFIDFNMGEILWSEMMEWPDNPFYENTLNKHDRNFWNELDNVWTTLWDKCNLQYEENKKKSTCQITKNTIAQLF